MNSEESPFTTEFRTFLSSHCCEEDVFSDNDSTGESNSDDEHEGHPGPTPIPPPPHSSFHPLPYSDFQDETYPAMEVGEFDIPSNEAGVIEAFVATDNIIDATGVAVVMDEEEGDKFQANRWLPIGLCLCVFIGVTITVPIVMTNGVGGVNVSSLPPTPSPSVAPSTAPSSSPTSSFFSATIRLIVENQISTPQSLFETGTPQNNALHWITKDDELQRPIDDPRYLQRYIAAVWYFSTDGDNWHDCSLTNILCEREPFLSSSDECEWHGITCIDDQIDKFFFGTTRGQNLVGTIPPELCHLRTMSQFFLENNFLHGTVPTCIGDLQTLRQFIVRNNSLESPLPKSLFDTPRMTQISMELNKFQEQFPDLSKMPLLREFRAYSNDFTGPIQGIENLTRLVSFEIHENQLTGTLPEAFANFPNLDSLTIQQNKFHGNLPVRLFNHTNLRRLGISNNSFVGKIPSYVNNFGRGNNRRKELYLDGNKLGGVIPSELGNIGLLSRLKLAGNEFVGTIPESLCALRGNRYNELSILEVDCAEVDCSCCTNC